MGWENSIGDAVVKYDLPAACLKRLGKARDVDLAEEFEVPVEQIRRTRKALGLPRFKLMNVAGPLLGKMPDSVLARRMGVPVQTIFHLRKQAGIPRCNLKQYNDHERLRAYIDAVKEF